MRKHTPILVVALLILGSLMVRAWAQSSSIINSAHNLSATGPGSIRSSSEQQVCIFCHTPHNASPVQPLWNRNLSVAAYIPYTSNSLQANPGQPTGTSKLCLSCHDGTIALGSVLSASQRITMAGGMTTLPPGHPSNLGTDLSDDHPISFRYDDALAGNNPKLRNPAELPVPVRLDNQKELQCTTCHDAHDNSFGKFLVMDNSNSQLCSSCHNHGHTDIAGHLQCASCHQPHSAPSGPYLLRGVTVSATCTGCHSSGSGVAGAADIQSDLVKLSRHDTNTPVDRLNHVPDNVVCKDCHEPHTMISETASAPLISPKLGNIDGVNASGSAISRARYEYEVCFKCHADQNASNPRSTSRQIAQRNTRLQFDPGAVSYHPVQAPGKSESPSLKPEIASGTLIYCTDCHASDTGRSAGGSGASGPHGSNVSPLLSASYSTTDGTTESSLAHALCYKCHDQTRVLAGENFPLHRKHVVDETTPCSVCHDPHGIASAQGNSVNNAHLMNFDISVVGPDPVTQRLEYRKLGPGTGECYLTCHNVPHSPRRYPVSAP